MATIPKSSSTIQFGSFELDVRAGELRKHGVRLPIQGRPIQLLGILLQSPGQMVSRDELHKQLWPADTFVDFEHGLHNAIARLREALGDSPDAPRYIETLPRRGYRFIGTVDAASMAGEPPEASSASTAQAQSAVSTSVLDHAEPASKAIQANPRSWAWLALAALSLCVAVLIGLLVLRRQRNPQSAIHQITFRRGTVWNARFTPDGNSVLYGAAWDGQPIEIYEGRLDSPEGRAYGMVGSDVEAISNSGELAVILNRKRGPSGFSFNGTLARLPLTRGASRPIMERIEAADWGPDGSIAVIYHADGKAKLEYPLGNVRYESATWLSDVRISPDGTWIAFIEHNEPIGDSGAVRLLGPGVNKQFSQTYSSAQGLAWTPSGKEVWYTGGETGNSRSLRAVDLHGRAREVYRAPGALKLQDIAKDGRVLMVHELLRAGILAHVPGEEGEKELGWLDWSIHRALSDDGKLLLSDESGDAPGGDTWIYLRRTDGSPAIKLGSGGYTDLSPDGKWVSAAPADFSGQLYLLPTGVGLPRTLHFPALRTYSTAWLPDGKHIALSASEAGKGGRVYIVDLDNATLRPITPEGFFRIGHGAVSPDGKFIAATGTNGDAYLFPVDGGAPRRLRDLQDGERVLGWTADGRSVYAGGIAETENRIFLVDLRNGRRSLYRTLAPSDKAGLTFLAPPVVTPDGKYYAYSYNRQTSELLVLSGLK